MNPKLKIFIYVLVASLIFVPTLYANEFNQGNLSPERREKMEKKIHEIYAQLNLTDEQKKLLDENKSKSRQERMDLFAKKKNYHEALRQELMQANLDMNKINEIHTQNKALQSQMADARLNSILEVRKILTPEQFGKFMSLMKEQKEKHRGMHRGDAL